jgi:chromosome segregation ATPase
VTTPEDTLARQRARIHEWLDELRDRKAELATIRESLVESDREDIPGDVLASLEELLESLEADLESQIADLEGDVEMIDDLQDVFEDKRQAIEELIDAIDDLIERFEELTDNRYGG